MLGEGWDAQRVNVLVDLTGAGTSVAVHQMRGRTLRLDPLLPRKVADNWDVVCVAPDHPKGASDYARFVRKHDRYFAPTIEGEIESGVSHVDHTLSPFGPPERAAFTGVNAAMMSRAHDREGAYARWAIGTPYENAEVETVRVRFGHSLGLPARDIWRHAAATGGGPRLSGYMFGIAGGAVAAGTFGLLAGTTLAFDPPLLGGLGVIGAAAVGAVWSGRSLQEPLHRLGPSDALEDLAAAVADGLRDAGALRPEIGAANVHVLLQDDGYYRCYLDRATRDESALFADALDELLGPLTSPRYIIPRYVAAEPPRSSLSAFFAALGYAVRGRVTDRVVYHAVPSYLGANKTRVQAFERAWEKHVSPGKALYCQDPRGAAILEVERGESPFATTSQIRTLWK